MEINNKDKILSLLDFSGENTFYFLQIMKRRKDGHPEMNRHTKVIKNYYISNREYFERKWEEIVGFCNFFKARACLRLNKRDYRSVSFKIMQYMAGMMANEDWMHCKNSFAKACGRGHSDPQKKWVVDVDSREIELLEWVVGLINQCNPYDLNKVIAKLDSPNGYHLITKPFDALQFRNRICIEKGIDKVDIKKDNPTNLYVPNLNN